MIIVKPEVGCPTGPTFARLDETEYEWRAFPTTDELYNDFERVAPCECLDLIERLRSLGARDAALSGSGSAVFGRFDSQDAAERAKESAVREGLGQAWAVRTLSRAESLAIREC
jgi:4-diphosphocytidyl-2C-methyl-D-erythritol kinase